MLADGPPSGLCVFQKTPADLEQGLTGTIFSQNLLSNE
jgi:hypothetical protein